KLLKQLNDPYSAPKAALRLEAIGKEAVETLKKGVESSDVEVRFYASEALAYLGEPAAVEPLAKIARDERAFRVYALTALSGLDESYGELRDLLGSPSAETRYGAFRALWTLDKNDPFVRGEMLGEDFHYHLIDTVGPPMIHATRSFRPEIVVFNHGQRLKTPLVLDAGPRIMIHSDGGDTVTVSRFSSNLPDERRQVSTKVDEVIRAVVDLGGTYPDVVQALQAAADSNVLAGRFEEDAIPQVGRDFRRPDRPVTDQAKADSIAAAAKEQEEKESAADSKPRVGFLQRLIPGRAWR
ncbi:MAG: HEAT repeat domain-containing protein, partial [Planctomycetales bacterium]